jgi:hypothetical protein
MKKILFLLLFPAVCFSQSEIRTAYANENNKVMLLLDSPIVSAVRGNNDFVFGYNKITPGKTGLLSATKGAKKTNLIVIVQSGKVYSFFLEYKKYLDPKDLILKIESKESNVNLNSEKRGEIVSIPKDSIRKTESISNNDYDYNHKEYSNDKKRYDSISEIIYTNKKNGLRRVYAKANSVYLTLKDYFFNKEQVYFYLEIENNSTVSFDINFLRFFTTTKGLKKVGLVQKILKGENGLPLSTYKFPKRVEGGATNRFVFVFNKFSLNKKKDLLIELAELKGERILRLNINSNIINFPQKIIKKNEN